MTGRLDLLAHPVVFAAPRRLTPLSAWHQHVPFGMLLIDLTRPDVLVELGVHAGDSYCAFCQAVATLRLPTRCYGVDTWKGDPQAGFYGEEVLTDLRSHHDPLYGSFSTLIESTFLEARAYFADGTVDLLHLDGCHTYEAVADDFSTWRSALSRRGVVVVHDINVREREFGAWRLWEKLRQQYPSFELAHGYGLGVLAIGPEPPPGIVELTASDAADTVGLREFFFRLGEATERLVQRRRAAGASGGDGAGAPGPDQLAEDAGVTGELVALRRDAALVPGLRDALHQLRSRLTEAEIETGSLRRERDGLRRDGVAVLQGRATAAQSRSWRLTRERRPVSTWTPSPGDGKGVGGGPFTSAAPEEARTRSLAFGSRPADRDWWHHAPPAGFVPPLYRALSDEEWAVLDDWFADTDERRMHGEINVTSMSVIQGFLAGSLVRNMVQLGTHAGYSTLLAGFVMRQMGRAHALLAIDIGEEAVEYTAAWVRRARLEEHVRVVQGDAGDPALPAMARAYLGTGVESVLIDASHEYERAAREIDLWVGALAPGGLLFLHDVSRWATRLDPTNQGGVHQAFAEWRARHPEAVAAAINGLFDGRGGTPVFKDGCGLGIVQKW